MPSKDSVSIREAAKRVGRPGLGGGGGFSGPVIKKITHIFSASL